MFEQRRRREQQLQQQLWWWWFGLQTLLLFIMMMMMSITLPTLTYGFQQQQHVILYSYSSDQYHQYHSRGSKYTVTNNRYQLHRQQQQQRNRNIPVMTTSFLYTNHHDKELERSDVSLSSSSSTTSSAPPTTTPTYNIQQHISELLDTALVLRLHIIEEEQQQSSSSWQWLIDQLDSIIQYLSKQYRIETIVITTNQQQQQQQDQLQSLRTNNNNNNNNNYFIVQQQLDIYQKLYNDVIVRTTSTMKSVESSVIIVNNDDNTNNNNNDEDDDNVQQQPSANNISETQQYPQEEYDDEEEQSSLVDDAITVIEYNNTENTITKPKLLNDTSYDIIIVGSGISGLCAGAILNTIYHKKVAIFESHSLPGGCAHTFTRTISIPSKTSTLKKDKITFTFDSGPSILLGCSATTTTTTTTSDNVLPNAIQQVLQIVQQNVTWIPYNGWTMIERNVLNNNSNNNNNNKIEQWNVTLGPTDFINGPLLQYGGIEAVEEYYHLCNITYPLTIGGKIPVMSMRTGSTTVWPLLLKHTSTLLSLIQQGEIVTGTFAPYIDGPIYIVQSQWLRNWLDALAFSLSGLSASRTAAAAMAFVLYDMHRSNATLDYPKGGMGEIVDALIRAIEYGPNGSKVYTNQHVQSIDSTIDGSKVIGVTLRNNQQQIKANDGVICNAPVWSLRDLIQNKRMIQKLNLKQSLINPKPKPPIAWNTTKYGSSINYIRSKSISSSSTTTTKPTIGLINQCDTIEMTASFLHLHIAIHINDLDISTLAPHYTVMDRSLSGDPSIVINGIKDGPCSMNNMIAVSNPCILDPSLAPEGYIVLHAYCAGNEPYELWEHMKRNSKEYIQYKEERAEVLWRAIECIIPDVRNRTVVQLIGTPLTHERFLRRPRGTYGSVTEDYIADGSTAISNLILASDSIFPGIGIPAVAIVGASAANSFVNVLEHIRTIQRLEERK